MDITKMYWVEETPKVSKWQMGTILLNLSVVNLTISS